MTPEEKVLEKIRKVLIADSTINDYVAKRIYASHISSIVEPKYPAISLFLLSNQKEFALRGYVSVNVQIDAWLPAAEYDASDILAIQDRIRTLLDRQNLTDTDIGLTVAQSIELEAGPFMHEQDTGLFHYPSRYNVEAT